MLSAGERLGPYEIVAPIGAGGMGEVYKALDTRLARSVAIKVLPEHIAQREDHRARFEREARAVASLNHPHICTLHDIGANYMVMELIAGENLAARTAKGPIPFDQALVFAAQLADAMDRAHRAGVTHRDIKPQNIMLTRDGVKVLDFGLAKSASAKPGPAEATLTQALTIEGSVMGTPQYMAPEQFEGREADVRSDIWAFGALLYEMVTGQKAFQGKSYSSLVGAILSADPPPMPLKPFTPAWLERLVRRCLQKDPDDRWQSMRDIALELKSPPVETAPVAASSRWPWVIAAVALAAAAAFALIWPRNKASSPIPIATELTAPDGTVFSSILSSGGSAISPDGTMLAFVATNDKLESLLYVRQLRSLTARALPGTDGAGRPFWSPDSKSLAFFAASKLKRIEIAGGAPVALCDATETGRGGDWNDKGMILFSASGGGTAVQLVSASGGTPTSMTHVNATAHEAYHYYPHFLPGGRDFFYLVRYSDSARNGIAFGSLDKSVARQNPATIALRTEYDARYDAATGKLL